VSAEQLIVGLVLGLGLGLVFAALGAGGGVLAVPVLLYVFHQPLAQATGTALAIVFGTALISAIAHFRRGNLDPKVALAFGGAALAGAPPGALLHHMLPERVTLVMFCAVLLIAAVRMWLASREGEGQGRFALLPTLGLGLSLGVLTGLLGVGGGFLIVPALSMFLGVPVRRAIGTSAAIVCASSLSGAATYALQGSLEPTLLAVVGTGAVAGAALGVPLAAKLPEAALRKAFAVIAVAVCARMLVSLVWGTSAH
jgi:uncharacterized membrane protein YfcA